MNKIYLILFFLLLLVNYLFPNINQELIIEFKKKYPSLEVINSLISKGAIINYSDIDTEMTPLMIAAEKGDLAIINFLLSIKNIDINLKDKFDKTALMYSIENNNLDIFNILFNHENIDLNVFDEYGNNILDYGLEKRIDMEHINMILSKDIRLVKLPEYVDSSYFNNNIIPKLSKDELIIFYKCYNKENETFLLKKHLPSAIIDLCYKIFLRNDLLYDEIVLKLNKHLETIINYNYNTLIQHFLTLGADINYKNSESFTLLMLAVIANNIEAVKILLKYKEIDINSINSFGLNALSYAIYNDNENIIKILKEYGIQEIKDDVIEEKIIEDHNDDLNNMLTNENNILQTKWVVEELIDPIDDFKKIFIYLVEDIEDNTYKYKKNKLILRINKDKSISIYIMWDSYIGVYEIYNGAYVTIRFDKNESINEKWNLSENGEATFYNGSSNEFIKNLINSTSFVARVKTSEKEITAVFSVYGLQEILEKYK